MEVPRSSGECSTSMRVKDALREGSIAELAEAVRVAIVDYTASAPALAASLLATFARYIG
eukprot:1192793-Prorocentrum_minimum.AAC.1